MLAAIFFLPTLLGSADAMVVEGKEMTIDQAIMAAPESPKIYPQMEEADVARVEMDVLFKPDVWESMMSKRENATRRQKRKAIREPNFRWANASVPYQIAVSFSDQERQQFQEALNDYHRYTCVRFRQVTASDTDYVRVVDGSGCSSYVGRQGGAQQLTLAKGCRSKGVILHELGHAIGFYHEHNRPDRDDFVKIVEKNVAPKGLHIFAKNTAAEVDSLGVPYDYLSVTHLGSNALSVNGQRTILTRDPAFQQRIGQRRGLSFRDIWLVNKMYGCSARNNCPEKQCPGEGFVGPDCACWCPSGNDAQPVTPCSG